MKKVSKFLLVLIILIFISIYILSYAKNWFAGQLGIDYMNKAEICSILTDNIDSFENAVDVLTNHKDPENYYIKITKASYDSPPFFDLLLSNQINIEGNEDIISKELKNTIKSSQIKYILKDLDFVMITATSDYISFINRTNIGFAPQIVYSIDGKIPDSLIFEDAENILGNWYYCSE